MAEFDLAISYETKTQRFGVLVFTSLFAAATLICELILIFGAYVSIWTRFLPDIPTYAMPSSYLAILLFSVAAMTCSCLGLVWFWDDRIQISNKGISLPNLFLMPMLGRAQRSWEDVLSLHLSSKDEIPLDKQTLTVLYKTGGESRIDLSLLSSDAIEQLLLSFEVWARQAEKDAVLLLLQSGLHDLKRGSGQISYTQLWEEEMNRRFGSTAFVPLQPGHQLQNGRLRVLKQLAFGGLSAIYMAQLNRTEAVVVKESVIVDAVSSAVTDKAKEIFAREAQLLAKLNHPQIARVRDYFVEQGRHYVVLDYLAGDDLKKIVRTRGPQSEEQVLRWALELARILEYLHGQAPAVVHRDLTPDNIVLSGNKIVLIDFGAANQLLTTATGTLIGKQSYISPEQFRGSAVPASDIYSLGCTMYFLLTGEDPEPLSTSHPRSLSARASIAMDELVASCTEFNTSSRIQSATELVGRIESLMEMLPARPTTRVLAGIAQ